MKRKFPALSREKSSKSLHNFKQEKQSNRATSSSNSTPQIISQTSPNKKRPSPTLKKHLLKKKPALKSPNTIGKTADAIFDKPPPTHSAFLKSSPPKRVSSPLKPLLPKQNSTSSDAKSALPTTQSSKIDRPTPAPSWASELLSANSSPVKNPKFGSRSPPTK